MFVCFFFSSRRRHTRLQGDWSSDVCSSDLTLTVNPQPVLLSSLGVNPMTVTGGSNSTGTATLDGPAPAGGAQVTLSSDNTAAATVPASVTVPAGGPNAPFTGPTSAGAPSTLATITPSYRCGNLPAPPILN